jgi:hypothetical protein
MEPTIQILAHINRENPNYVKTLIESGTVKELEGGQKYLVIEDKIEE